MIDTDGFELALLLVIAAIVAVALQVVSHVYYAPGPDVASMLLGG